MSNPKVLAQRSAQQEERRKKLAALGSKFFIELRDEIEECDSASEEDLWEYLRGDKWIDPWVAVTYHDGDSSHYYLKTFATRREAEDYTIEHVTDDIFTESPVAVVDLDDPTEPWGKEYRLLRLIAIYEGSDL